jgi:branched-chain amino acid transport system substrate-binding protein
MRPLLLLLALASAQAWGEPLVLGAVLPQSGQLVDLATDMQRALTLWQESRNAAGGLLGRRVELKVLDDHSEGSASTRLYERLIDVEHVDLLIGPFGSAASVSAAAVAERRRRVLVNATGVTRNVQRAGARYVFQVPAPLADYGEGALEIVRAMGYRRLHVVARGDPAAREAAAQLVERAAAAGLEPGPVQSVPAGASDYRAQIAKARARDAQAWISFGQPEDAADMVKSFKHIGYAPWLFLAQGAAEPKFLQLVGRDAELVLGITSYDAAFRTRGNPEFVDAWRKRWSTEPGATAATAYAAVLILEAAVRRAGSVESERLRTALSGLDTETPIGRYRVDAGGVQTGAKPAVVQIVAGRREIVWPEALATAKWRLPYPRWDERQDRAAQ